MPVTSLIASVDEDRADLQAQRAEHADLRARRHLADASRAGRGRAAAPPGAPAGGADQNTVTWAWNSCTTPHTSGTPRLSQAAATASRVSNVSVPSITTCAPASRSRALSAVRRSRTGRTTVVGREVGGHAHRRVDLGPADIRSAVHDLALQIGCLDHVVVDDGEGADARRGEGEHDRRAEAAGADDGDVRGGEAALAEFAESGEAACRAVRARSSSSSASTGSTSGGRGMAPGYDRSGRNGAAPSTHGSRHPQSTPHLRVNQRD